MYQSTRRAIVKLGAYFPQYRIDLQPYSVRGYDGQPHYLTAAWMCDLRDELMSRGLLPMPTSSDGVTERLLLGVDDIMSNWFTCCVDIILDGGIRATD